MSVGSRGHGLGIPSLLGDTEHDCNRKSPICHVRSCEIMCSLRHGTEGGEDYTCGREGGIQGRKRKGGKQEKGRGGECVVSIKQEMIVESLHKTR